VLGSRIQYQVRVHDHVFIVEKLRQQAFSGQRDDSVLIGWDAKDSILVTD
jgi:spermidine/putrescine transport system ATP-binding protein